MIRTSKLFNLAILFLGVVGVLANEAAAQRVTLRAKLATTGIEQKASGAVQYEQKGKHIEFALEAEGLYVSKKLSVFVAGRLIGITKVDVDGNADLHLSNLASELQNGDSVEVRNQDGKPVLRGVLRGRKAADPVDGNK